MRATEKAKWIEDVRERYRKASRVRKKELLNEVVDLFQVHRKSAIRLLSRSKPGRPAKPKRGRVCLYRGTQFLTALRLVWRQTDFMCAKLLHEAIPDWVPAIEQVHGEFSEEVRKLLFKISKSSIDRALQPYRFKTKGGTKPGTLVKNQIPIQGNIWDIGVPGFMEADTVAHCGSSMEGLFAWSLTMTDICTQWTECRAVWHKAAQGVVEQVKDIEASIPFILRGFDCDNGSEFLNNYLLAYFSEKRRQYIDFTFTRSRPYRKNDNAHVEQRNWTHPRRIFDRIRIDEWELVGLMNDLYSNEFSLLRNHFYPTLKLSQKVLIKSRYRRIYDTPKTPYQRIMESPHVTDEIKSKLFAQHSRINPVLLSQAIRHKQHRIFALLKSLKKHHLRSNVA